MPPHAAYAEARRHEGARTSLPSARSSFRRAVANPEPSGLALNERSLRRAAELVEAARRIEPRTHTDQLLALVAVDEAPSTEQRD
jgi:hypothetical protein